MSALVPVTVTSRLARLVRRAERGMTTAEYAVGTAAVIGFGTLLMQIFVDEETRQAIHQIVDVIVDIIINVLNSVAS